MKRKTKVFSVEENYVKIKRGESKQKRKRERRKKV